MISRDVSPQTITLCYALVLQVQRVLPRFRLHPVSRRYLFSYRLPNDLATEIHHIIRQLSTANHVRTFRHYLLSVVFPDTPPVNTSAAFGDLNSEWRRLLAYHLGLREAHIEQVARSRILTDPTLLNTTFSAIVVDNDTDSSNEDDALLLCYGHCRLLGRRHPVHQIGLSHLGSGCYCGHYDVFR